MNVLKPYILEEPATAYSLVVVRTILEDARRHYETQALELSAQAQHAEDVADAARERIAALEASTWFLADETTVDQDEAWLDAAEAYEKAAGVLRGHLEWRDRVRAAVRVLMNDPGTTGNRG